MLIAETAFTTRHKEMRSQQERELRAGLQLTHESSAIHLDLLTHLKRINNSVTHVAYAIVQADKGRA